jgi:hypothetical protein
MAKPAPRPPAKESFPDLSWFGSLKRYGQGKRHDLASVRKSIARERRRRFLDRAVRPTKAADVQERERLLQEFMRLTFGD